MTVTAVPADQPDPQRPSVSRGRFFPKPAPKSLAPAIMLASVVRKQTCEVVYPMLLTSLKLGIRVHRERGRFQHNSRLPGVIVRHLRDNGYTVRRWPRSTVVTW